MVYVYTNTSAINSADIWGPFSGYLVWSLMTCIYTHKLKERKDADRERLRNWMSPSAKAWKRSSRADGVRTQIQTGQLRIQVKTLYWALLLTGSQSLVQNSNRVTSKNEVMGFFILITGKVFKSCTVTFKLFSFQQTQHYKSSNIMLLREKMHPFVGLHVVTLVH